MAKNSDALEILWTFVRGDLEASNFEHWIYTHDEVESTLGSDCFLEAISINFADTKQVNEFRHRLKKELPVPAACSCHTLSNKHLLTMGGISLEGFEHLVRGVRHMFWLHRFRCKTCHTEWWLAEEARIYDVWILFRSWDTPPSLNTYHELLSMAVSLGASVRYFQPEVSIEIPITIEELAQEKPGMKVSEIAQLIPVPLEIIRQHARDVALKTGLHIDFE